MTKDYVLFRRYLTVDQWNQLREFNKIEVIGSFTGRKYVINTSGKVLYGSTSYCCVPKDYASLPKYDKLLMLKIAIENDERYFLRHSMPSSDREQLRIFFIAVVSLFWPWWRKRR